FLAHRAQKLSADIILPRPAIAHHAFAGADHHDPHAVEDLGQLLDAAIDPAAGLAGAVDHVNDLVAVHPVLELHADLALLLVVDDVVLLDVPFILEHLRNAA